MTVREDLGTDLSQVSERRPPTLPQSSADSSEAEPSDAMRPLGHDDLWSIPVPSDPQLSPNGRQVAYVVTTADQEHDDYRSTIWVAAVGGGSPRQLTNGPRDQAPRWAPDGQRLAFLRSQSVGMTSQIYLMDLDGGEPSRLTDLPAGAGEPAWSPDGSRVALAATTDVDGAADHAPVVTARLDYKADGTGLIRKRRCHLFVVEIPSKATAPTCDAAPAQQVTFGDYSTSCPVWSPDGSRLAFDSSCNNDRDLAPASVIYSVPAAGGRLTQLSPSRGVYHLADWSPDGQTILVYGQPNQSAGNDHLYTLPAAGGEPVRLSPKYDCAVSPGVPGYPGATPRFSDDGSRVLFCARDRGAVHVLEVPAEGGEPSVVVGGDRVVAGISTAHGLVTFVASSARSPGEVWLKDGQERPVTSLFATALPDVRLLEPTPIQFRGPDGAELHGWILRRETAGAGPLLVDIHGGPHNAWGPAFDGGHVYQHTLAAAGWTVLTLNPRASDGYGDDFRTATVGSWGYRDEADFLCAVDALVGDGLADPERLCVCGYSYGGYMTCWLTARTDRFVAAVAGGCISDLVSFAGTSDLGGYVAGIEMDASVVDRRDALVDSSPITHAGAVSTPTLILHGENDDRCPVGQGEQWFAALRAQRVPVEFVRYPGQSHLFVLNGRPSHRIDYSRRVEWWLTTWAASRKKPVRASEGSSLAARELRHRLDALIARHGVPGASIAVLKGGEVTSAAAGVLNVDTQVPVTADSVFQIGSITKVYTATLAMQLVDEGLVDLDTPVIDVLPDFRVADPEVTATVTLRHLLTHTSGIAGDHFPDVGRGDDCVARFVASCATLGQTHALGATMSYCNTGFVIAGRVIEQLTGQTWDRALAEHLSRPLGLDETVTLPEEVLRFRAAVGHFGKSGQPPQVAPLWGLPRGGGPAGLVCATAADVVAFAGMHLGGGCGPDGTRLLSHAAVRMMQRPHVTVPDPYTLGSHCGVGWMLFDWDGRDVFGHDGDTLGQAAYLRVVPDREVAVALLINGGEGQALFDELFPALLQELADVGVPARPRPPIASVEPDFDLGSLGGIYERLGLRIEIAWRDRDLTMRTILTGPLASLLPDPVADHRLVALKDGVLLASPFGKEAWTPVVFYRLADGSPCVHFAGRATPKTR